MKLLIQRAGEEPFRQLQLGRVDLVGRTAVGRLLHIELQSTNDPRMRQSSPTMPVTRAPLPR